MIPKNSKNQSFSNELNPGQIVLYEHNGAAILAVVERFDRGKFTLTNQRGREASFAANRIKKLPGKIPGDVSSTQAKADYLNALETECENKIDTKTLEEIWSFVAEDSREYHVDELCDLYFGKNELKDNLSLNYILLNDGIYFKRKRHTFIPRPLETIEELRKAEAAREEKMRARERSASFFADRKENPELPIPEELESAVELLLAVAADAPHIDNAHKREAQELINFASQALKLELGGKMADQAYHILKIAHFIGKRTDPAVLRHSPLLSFSSEALEQAEDLPEPPEFDSHTDYTQLEAVTIDDAATKDMDDALSIEQTSNGYRLGIHISDVASLIAPGSALDKSAKLRATSIYSPSGHLNMLPKTLSHDKASLVANKERLCLSYFFEVDHQYNVGKCSLEKTVIKVHQKLSYDEVDELLETDSGTLHHLYNIASVREAERLGSGGSKIPKRIKAPVVDEKGKVSIVEIDEGGPARSLIGEMMILANVSSAEYAAENNIPVPYRSQPAPTDNREIDPDIPEGPAYHYALRSKLKRSEVGFSPASHATLGVDAYTQTTSPIRRYLDLCCQRQLISFLDKGKPLYTQDEFAEILLEIESELRRANTITRESTRFWQLRWLEQQNRKGTTMMATVLRTDLKNPMLEIDELVMTTVTKLNRQYKPGDEVQLKIAGLNAWQDYFKLEAL